MATVFKQGFSVVNSLIYRLITTKDETILDPLSVAIRLALLCYKPRKTKISIGCTSKYSIEYDEPDVQSLQRLAKGSTRNDLATLNLPIKIAVNLYNFDNPYIVYIFQKACDGLKELLSCYTNDNAATSIQFFRSILLNELAKSKGSNKNNSLVDSPLFSNMNTTNYTMYNTNNNSTNNNITTANTTNLPIIGPIIFDKHIDIFKTLWTANSVQIIYSLLIELETESCNYKNSRQGIEDIIIPSYIRAVCEIVDTKDKLLERKIGEKYKEERESNIDTSNNHTTNNNTINPNNNESQHTLNKETE